MTPVDEIHERRLGQTVGGRWTLTRLLGEGGMAAVYAAQDPQGAIAAIKLLHPEMGIRRDIRERFLREASVMTRINHPGMVTIYEQGSDNDTAFLAMELLEGEVLTERVRRLGRVPPGEVLNILDQLLDVLALAHGLGIIHRDLKPENLFLTNDGRVKVLDFGLARLMFDGPGSFRTRTGAALGTLPYMAPEQALGRRDEIDARTDLFAVGATAFRLLSGRRIHEAPSEAELLMRMASEPAPKLLVCCPDVPPGLAHIVDRSLAFSKLARYPDATTMQADVRAVLAGAEPPFAVGELEREESSTRVDRMAPTSLPQSALPKSGPDTAVRSQRQVATLVMPVSGRPPSVQSAATVDDEPKPLAPLSPTASMPAERQPASTVGALPTLLAPTQPDSTAAVVAVPPATSEALPVEAVAALSPHPEGNADIARAALDVNRQRRRTLFVGLLLVGLLVAITGLTVAWLASRWSQTAGPEVRPPKAEAPLSRAATIPAPEPPIAATAAPEACAAVAAPTPPATPRKSGAKSASATATKSLSATATSAATAKTPTVTTAATSTAKTNTAAVGSAALVKSASAPLKFAPKYHGPHPKPKQK